MASYLRKVGMHPKRIRAGISFRKGSTVAPSDLERHRRQLTEIAGRVEQDLSAVTDKCARRAAGNPLASFPMPRCIWETVEARKISKN